jgi:aspartyl-tRNA(Asn)/glutamyl-tRNA(Gln) amidotransferase subunit A
VVGLKVTHGRIPIAGVFPLAPSLDTVGPIARTVSDAAVLYHAMAGDDPLDPWSVPQPVELPRAAGVKGLRVGIPRPWVDDRLDPVVAAGFERAVQQLLDAGATVTDIDAPQPAPPGVIVASSYFEVARIHRAMWTRKPDGYGPNIRARLEQAFTIEGDDYLAALEWRASTRSAVDRWWNRVDVIATPTVAALRKAIGVDELKIAGKTGHYREPLSRFTALVNQMGLPALAVPLACEGTPPPSLQLIGPAWSEERLLAIGGALETEGISGFRRPPHWFGS